MFHFALQLRRFLRKKSGENGKFFGALATRAA